MPPANHDKVWRCLQDNGYDGAIAAAGKLGVEIDRRAARAHFEYHCPRQSAPPTASHKKALEYMENTTKRRQEIADLIFRVPGLTGALIGQSLLWHGDSEKLHVADKAAQRDLKILQRVDAAHRVFLQNLDGVAARPIMLKGLFFLGGYSRAYIEKLHGITINKADWVKEQSQLGDWRTIYPNCEAHAVIARLQTEMPGNIDMRFTIVDGVAVGWDTKNWLGHNLMPKYKDPLHQGSAIRANGMVALSIKVEDETRLLPFYYHVDTGSRSPDSVLEDLLGPLQMERSMIVQKTFPDIDGATVIPTVVICSSRERLNQLREESARKAVPRERIVSIACVADSFDLTSPVFSLLFHNVREKRSLISVLQQFYEKRPVTASRLRWQGIRGPKQKP